MRRAAEENSFGFIKSQNHDGRRDFVVLVADRGYSFVNAVVHQRTPLVVSVDQTSGIPQNRVKGESTM